MPLDELIVKSDEKWIEFRIQLTLGILIIYSIICLILTVAEHESLKTFIGYFLIISPIFPIGLWRWWNCIWRVPTAGFAEQNGRNAKLNSR